MARKRVGMMDWIGHVLKIDPKNDSNVVLGGRWESGVTHEVRKQQNHPKTTLRVVEVERSDAS